MNEGFPLHTPFQLAAVMHRNVVFATRHKNLEEAARGLGVNMAF